MKSREIQKLNQLRLDFTQKRNLRMGLEGA